MGLFWGDKSSSHLDETCKLFWGKIAPGTSSSFSFKFSCFFSPFNSTFCFAILSCFNSAETFHYSVRHVCLHSPPTPLPPNNLINACARLVCIPGYHSISKWAIVKLVSECEHLFAGGPFLECPEKLLVWNVRMLMIVISYFIKFSVVD